MVHMISKGSKESLEDLYSHMSKYRTHSIKHLVKVIVQFPYISEAKKGNTVV